MGGDVQMKIFIKVALGLWKKMIWVLVKAQENKEKVADKVTELTEKLNQINGAIGWAIENQDKQLKDLDLGQWNVFSGEFVKAEMVKGFLKGALAYYKVNQGDINEKLDKIQQLFKDAKDKGVDGAGEVADKVEELKKKLEGITFDKIDGLADDTLQYIADVVNEALKVLGNMTIGEILSAANGVAKDIVEFIMFVYA